MLRALAIVCLSSIGCGNDTTTASDATTDGPTSDVVSEAASEGGVDGAADADANADASGVVDATDECVIAPQTQCPPCGNDGGSVCCTQTDTCIAPSASGCLGFRWACQTRSDCPQGDDCCINFNQLSFSTCPPSASGPLQPVCGLAGSCTGAPLCSSDTECSSQHCVGVVVSGVSKPLGVCH